MALDLFWTDKTSYIGSYKKGRRKGSKNRSLIEKLEEKEEKNELKRRNERQRVKNISQQYNRLRRALGDPHPEKKLRKQILQTGSDLELAETTMVESDTSSTSESSAYVCSDHLQCKESFTESFTSSPTPPIIPEPHHHYPTYSYIQHSQVPQIPPALPALTTMASTVCHVPFEWNMTEWNMAEMDLMEEYNFFSSPIQSNHAVFGPPPLHHLY